MAKRVTVRARKVAVTRPEVLWVPSLERQQRSAMRAFVDSAGFSSYDDTWRWSVDPLGAAGFWEAVAERLGVAWRAAPSAAIVEDLTAASGVRWFPDATLNYAELCLSGPDHETARKGASADAPAVIGLSQTRGPCRLSWRDLRSMVARARTGLLAAGVGRGDRVGAYLPNVPETLALMLATASLGAVWACCAPEMGVDGCVERLAQFAPKVLVAVDGYRYGAKTVDRRAEAAAIAGVLDSASTRVWFSYLHSTAEIPPSWVAWDVFTGEGGELDFEAVPFDHPLYVLFSSGTTGRPKGIVHGHGGIAVEHAKALRLHFDLAGSDRFFWYTTTGWMMWNFLVSGLLAGSTVVLYDGDPSGPQGDNLWRIVADEEVTCAGVGSGYLAAGAKAALTPARRWDLSRMVTLGATGSPLPADAARWVYRDVQPDVMLAPFSGGTDVCTGFVGPSPLHPVVAGEISCRCLGAKVEVFDERGDALVGEEGELVLSAPLPSMPVGLLGDDDGSRLRSTYFERYPGVWHHGDRAVLSDRGTVIITGRSDGTLNRGGVRMGTAELYFVVESLPEVTDSLAVHLEDPDGGPGQLVLLVASEALSDRSVLDKRIRDELRSRLSPRHVPDRVEFVPSIPRTLSGKKLEVPVKRILLGADPDVALSSSTLADPASIEAVVELARRG